jgi:hypothetical protein
MPPGTDARSYKSSEYRSTMVSITLAILIFIVVAVFAGIKSRSWVAAGGWGVTAALVAFFWHEIRSSHSFGPKVVEIEMEPNGVVLHHGSGQVRRVPYASIQKASREEVGTLWLVHLADERVAIRSDGFDDREWEEFSQEFEEGIRTAQTNPPKPPVT